MSTKTTFKRVALVTVAALGFGVLGSVAPANAAHTAAAATVMTVTLDSTSTSIAGRVGQQISIPVTGGNTATTGASGNPVLSIAAAITSQPATSAVYAALGSVATGTIAGVTTRLETIDSGLTYGSTATTTLTATNVGTSSTVATVNYSSASDQSGSAMPIIPAGSALGTVFFTPTVAGTYTVVVWNEKDRAFSANFAAHTRHSQ
jgi:hypothetical protein